MVWERRFSFEQAASFAKGKTRKKEIDNAPIDYYNQYLKKRGLPVKKLQSIKWDKDNKTISVQIKTGRCKHLSFTKEDKAECLNYKKRPVECRHHLCKKVRHEIILERIKEREKSAKLLKYHFEQRQATAYKKAI